MKNVKSLIEELTHNTKIARGIIETKLSKSYAFENIQEIGDEIVKCEEFTSQYTLIDIECGYTDGGGWVNENKANVFRGCIANMYNQLGWTLNNDEYCPVYVSPDKTEFTYNHGMELTGFLKPKTKNQILRFLARNKMLGNRFENGSRIPDIDKNFGESFYTHIKNF